MPKCSSAAVDLKIEVSETGLGTEEEFDATVEANHVLVLRGPGNHVSIVDLEANEQIYSIVQNPNARVRSMVAAFGMKIGNLKLVGLEPKRMVQADFAGRRR